MVEIEKFRWTTTKCGRRRWKIWDIERMRYGDDYANYWHATWD